MAKVEQRPCPWLESAILKSYVACLGPESYIGASVKLYRGIKFRPGIILTMQENTFIGDNVVVLVPKLIMEKGSQICAGTILAGRDRVVLEENAVVGYNCLLLTSSDNPRGEFMSDASPEKKRIIIRGPILLKKNSFIGSKSIIMPNVKIGERTVVGAHSYIDASLPSGKVTPRYFQTPKVRW